MDPPGITGGGNTRQQRRSRGLRARRSTVELTLIFTICFAVFSLLILHRHNLARNSVPDHNLKLEPIDRNSVQYRNNEIDTSTGMKTNKSDYRTTQMPNNKTMKEMIGKNLTLSIKQQRKFFSIQNHVLDWICNDTEQQHLLYATAGGSNPFFAWNLNNDFAYRHIYKNGGTRSRLR